jgi:hypothetical protein
MDYIDVVRKLARSDYWQSIYSSAKDVGSIQLFENKNNYSGLQSLFLYWLKIYDLLYTELSQKEFKYLDEEVINDDYRCDAFLYYRSQIKESEINKQKLDNQVNKLNFKDKGATSVFNVDFQ